YKVTGVQTCALPIYLLIRSRVRIEQAVPGENQAGPVGFGRDTWPAVEQRIAIKIAAQGNIERGAGLHDEKGADAHVPFGIERAEIGRASWRERVETV